MKKIGIVTVFYTENCGSVLQAKCLADKLAEYNLDVYFISTINSLSGHSFKRLFKNCIKKLLKKESVISSIKKYFYYKKYFKKNFRIVSKSRINSLSSVYFGSDTIWDVNSNYFLLSQDLFWGYNTNFSNIPMYSYSASIANSSYDYLDSLIYPVNQLKKFKMISARDNYTKNYISDRTKMKVDLVCDPTLLFGYEYYKKYLVKRVDSRYLLLYLFNEPSDEIKNQIIRFAKKRNLKIICMIGVGKLISFADEYIESTIENFITYFYYADYIITNTFHGTIFSIIFNKKFVVLDYKKLKIKELLNMLSVPERLVVDNIEKCLICDIDYKKVNNIIDELRCVSLKYLERTMK